MTYNNPVAIAGSETVTVHFLFCVEYMRAFYMRSDDDGQTFSKPVEITPAFCGFRRYWAWVVPGDRAGARNPVEKRQAAGAGLALAGKRRRRARGLGDVRDLQRQSWRHVEGWGDRGAEYGGDRVAERDGRAVQLADGSA